MKLPPALCDVLIPSRGRSDRLRLAIRSVIESARMPNRIRIYVRLDSDDFTSIDLMSHAKAWDDRIHLLIGKRGNGYADLALFYDELVQAGKAPWMWIFNDDTQIHADTRANRTAWDDQLAGFMSHKTTIVHPWTYQLGNSAYHGTPTAFPILEREAWQFNPVSGPAIDTLYNTRASVEGWDVRYLRGVRVIHDRDPDDQITAHRAL